MSTTLDSVGPLLLSRLGSDALESVARDDGFHLRVGREAWHRAGELLRREITCSYFSFLSAIDWLPNPDLDGEHVFAADRAASAPQEIVTDPVIRLVGGQTRFQIVARVADVSSGVAVTLYADLPDDDLSVSSWVDLYRGADWHERETSEMFGIDFEGHPDLRHIYLPSEFEGHPLRKDYSLLSRVVRPWPGLVDMEEMPSVPAIAAPDASDADAPDVSGASEAEDGS